MGFSGICIQQFWFSGKSILLISQVSEIPKGLFWRVLLSIFSSFQLSIYHCLIHNNRLISFNRKVRGYNSTSKSSKHRFLDFPLDWVRLIMLGLTFHISQPARFLQSWLPLDQFSFKLPPNRLPIWEKFELSLYLSYENSFKPLPEKKGYLFLLELLVSQIPYLTALD